MDNLRTFINLPLKNHLLFGTFVRLALIAYANYHDDNFAVSYTDVDYKVFTDAARHVYDGKSPYKRHTYRYSPLIAYLLLPNIFLFKEFGKILFTVFDVFITLAVKKLVEYQLGWKDKKKQSLISTYCALFWLYNPMSIAISTRGNADSVPCFFIILSVFFLQTDMIKSRLKYALSGILLGVSIHLRLYPIFFSFPMYLSLEPDIRRVTFKDVLLLIVPNRSQLTLALSCVLTLVFLTLGMYFLYGYEFLFETYLYHLFRKDTKHNFSILFYHSYLTMNDTQFDILNLVVHFLKSVILFVLSLTFGLDPKTLPFGLFCQTVVLVAYNSVITSQYFVWFLSLLPLVVHSFKISFVDALTLVLIWVAPQAAWLFFAYLLEFQSREVFFYIWMMSVLFFCANIVVLSRLIKCFTPGYSFGEIDAPLRVKKQT